MIFLIIFIAVLLLAIFLYLQNNLIDVTKYRLKSENIINRIKIVHKESETRHNSYNRRLY